MEIRFTIHVRVRPKQATGVRRRQRKNGTVYYVPTQQRADANAIMLRWALERHIPGRPLIGPIRAAYRFVFKYPKRLSAAKRRFPYIPHPGPPDPDNLAKQVSDVLQAAGFFVDDRQIVRLESSMEYGDADALEVVLSSVPNPWGWEATTAATIAPAARNRPSRTF
jgi:Holliday junction resolvase RusA-like endonuclease